MAESDAVYCNEFVEEESGYLNFQSGIKQDKNITNSLLKRGTFRSSKTPIAKPRLSKMTQADDGQDDTVNKEEENPYECIDIDNEDPYATTILKTEVNPFAHAIVNMETLKTTGACADIKDIMKTDNNQLAPGIPSSKPSFARKGYTAKSPIATPKSGQTYVVAHVSAMQPGQLIPSRRAVNRQTHPDSHEYHPPCRVPKQYDKGTTKLTESGYTSDTNGPPSYTKHDKTQDAEPGYVSTRWVNSQKQKQIESNRVLSEINKVFQVSRTGGRFVKSPVSLYIPENALALGQTSVQITVSKIQGELPRPHLPCMIVSQMIQLQPHGYEFQQPVTLYLELDTSIDSTEVDKLVLFYSNTAEGEPCHWEILLQTDMPTNPKRPCILCTNSRSITAILPTFCKICVGKRDGSTCTDIDGTDLFIALILETEYLGKVVTDGPCLMHAKILLSFRNDIQEPNIIKRGKLKIFSMLGHVKISSCVRNNAWKIQGNSEDIVPEIILQNGYFPEITFCYRCDASQITTTFAVDVRFHQEYSQQNCETIIQEKGLLGNLPQKNISCQVLQVSEPIAEHVKTTRKPTIPVKPNTRTSDRKEISNNPKSNSLKQNPLGCTIKSDTSHSLSPTGRVQRNVKSLTQKYVNITAFSNDLDKNKTTLKPVSSTATVKPQIISPKPKVSGPINKHLHTKVLTYHSLPEQVKQAIADELDVEHPIGQDWRMLLEYLGLGNKVDVFRSRARLYQKSPTIMVLETWATQTEGSLSVLEGALRSMDREHVIRHIQIYTTTGNTKRS